MKKTQITTAAEATKTRLFKIIYEQATLQGGGLHADHNSHIVAEQSRAKVKR